MKWKTRRTPRAARTVLLQLQLVAAVRTVLQKKANLLAAIILQSAVEAEADALAVVVQVESRVRITSLPQKVARV